MIRSARVRREPLTVLMFDQVDLPELHVLFGGLAARRVVSKFNRNLAELADPSGLPVRCGPTTWTVLLPRTGEDGALAAIRKVFGAGWAIEGEGSELLLVPRVALRPVGTEPVTMRQLHVAMAEEIQQKHLRDLRRERATRRRAVLA